MTRRWRRPAMRPRRLPAVLHRCQSVSCEKSRFRDGLCHESVSRHGPPAWAASDTLLITGARWRRKTQLARHGGRGRAAPPFSVCGRLLRDSERPCRPQVCVSCGRHAYARRQHHGGLYDSVLAPLPRPQVSRLNYAPRTRPRRTPASLQADLFPP